LLCALIGLCYAHLLITVQAANHAWINLEGVCFLMDFVYDCHSLVTEDAVSVIRTVQTVSKSQNLTVPLIGLDCVIA